MLAEFKRKLCSFIDESSFGKRNCAIRSAIKMQSEYLYKYFIVCDCFCMRTSGTYLM